MRHVFAAMLTVQLCLLSAGCRQADGPMPEPNSEDQNEIGDLSRDMLAVAAGERQAIDDMTLDLGNLGSEESAQHLAPEMGKRLVPLLTARKLSGDQARSLAGQMYLTFAADKLSRRQVSRLQDDVRTTLRATGAPQERIEPVVEQIAAVQEMVTTNARRWWHIGN